MSGQRRDKVLILREFGDGILEKMTTTRVRAGSAGVPEAHGKKRTTTEKISYPLTDLKEQFTVMGENLSLRAYLES